MPTEYRRIGECAHKGQAIVLERDDRGKFHIHVDGITKQRKMSANEMARWFLNALEDGSEK